MQTIHLRIALHPSIVASENIVTIRSFYKFINNLYSPDMYVNSLCSTNCFFPFENGSIKTPSTRGNVPPPNAGYTVFDYRISEAKAKVLLQKIRFTSDYQVGHVLVYDMTTQDSMRRYFFTPTQKTYQDFRDDWNPVETLKVLTGHIPEGSQMTMLGIAIRTSSSLLLHVDLSQHATSEGLTTEEPLSKLMFDNNGFLTYRAHDVGLVRHTVAANPWTLIPEDPTHALAPLDIPKAMETPNTIFARAPPTVLIRDIRRVAACLGNITACKLSSLTNTFEQVVEITFKHEQSMWLADGFQLGSVKLTTTKSYAAIGDSMSEMNDSAAEDDRVLAACI